MIVMNKMRMMLTIFRNTTFIIFFFIFIFICYYLYHYLYLYLLLFLSCPNAHRTTVYVFVGLPYSFGLYRSMVVVLNGYETIFSAFVRHSEAFADRGSAWLEENVINHERRGQSSR